MFGNTISLTVGINTYELLRVNQDNYGSEYRFSNGERALSMKIRHSVDKPDGDSLVMGRHNVLLEHIVYPTPTQAMKKYTSTVTLRHDRFSNPADSSALYAALAAWLGTGTVSAELVAGGN